MRGEFIDVGRARLYYYASGSRGEGEPLLLIHGFPTSSHLWARMVPLVPPGHRVVVPDLLGFGRSDPPGDTAADLSVPGHAWRLGRLLDVLGVSSACLVGHGIGAAIALEMWRAHGERVTRLGLFNPVGSLATTPAQLQLASLVQRLPGSLLLQLGRRRLAHLYRDAGAHGPAIDHYFRPFSTAAGRALLRAHMRALTPIANAEWVETAVVPDGPIAPPTVVLCGEQDPRCPPTMAERLASRIPGSVLHRMAGGHMSPEESPEQVVEVVQALLRASQRSS